MRETPEDINDLQALLDRSYAAAGDHLKSIVTPERRIDAESLVETLIGVQVLALATVTADGRPLAGPVDGLFYRGEFWFGSSPNSVRFRHIRVRPHVSATHTRGEQLAVTVHGTAHEIDVSEHPGFEDVCIETYGEGWSQWGDGAAYARITAEKMFTFGFEG